MMAGYTPENSPIPGGRSSSMALYTPEVQESVDQAIGASRKVPRYERTDPCDDPKVTGPEVWQQNTNAHSICTRAAQIVAGARAVEHGPKERNHKNIAVLWEAYMQLKEANGESTRFISAYDVATMMELLKIARRLTGAGRTNPDNYIDGAGYCGIAGEIALNGAET